MAIVVSPYIHFVDNAREAIDFYKTIFGCEPEIHEFAETVQDEKFKHLVMHCELNFAGTKFFISDSLPMGGAKQGGENVDLSITGTKEDEETLTKYFEGLSEGGKIEVPLQAHPWGATFGMLTDKYGIHWMVNIADA